MSTLLLRLDGPMQAWGTQSRFRYRDTGLEPSKSGVIGLLCAALGRPRWEPVADLAALRMGVRVDRPGVLKIDFHTVGSGYVGARPPGASSAFRSKARPDTGIISHRYYLSDASFLVGLEGPHGLLGALDEALARPVWQICLGRKAFPPALPVRQVDGLRNTDLQRELRSWPHSGQEKRVRFVIDAPEEGTEVRNDVPLSFANRTFASRRVRTYWEELEL